MSEEATRVEVAVIGGGVVGLTVANKLAAAGKEVALIERVGKLPNQESQTMASAGVTHAGIYYPSSTMPLKAELCVAGNPLLYQFCRTHNVSIEQTGKLVVGNSDLERSYLEATKAIGDENGVHGLFMLDRESDIHTFEPNVQATSALYVSTSGVVYVPELMSALVREAEKNKVMTVLGNEVSRIETEPLTLYLKDNRAGQTIRPDILINAAGLESADIARLVNPDSPYEYAIVRGESAKFNPRAETMVRMNVYPAPFAYDTETGRRLEVPLEELVKLEEQGKAVRTTGVHLTPTYGLSGSNSFAFSGPITISPLKKTRSSFEDLERDLYPPQEYFSLIQSFFPNLRLEEIHLGYAGYQATLVGSHHDFVIERDPLYDNVINLIGIDSPGLTASPAIANKVLELLK